MNTTQELNSIKDSEAPIYLVAHDTSIRKKSKLIIAIDFDGTIVEHEFPRIGNLKTGAKEVINSWYDYGHDIIIWTCRNMVEPNHPEWDQAPVGAVIKFLNDNGVKFTTINADSPNIPFYLQTRKVFADMYIDDRNMGGFPGWDVAQLFVPIN